MQKLSEHPSYACCSHTAPTKAETHHAYKIQSTVSKRHRTHYNTRHKTLTNTHGTRAPTVTGKLHPTLYAETDIPEGEVEEAQYPGGRYYAEVLELKKLSAYASDATEHFMSPFKYLNTVCFQGAQFMYNYKQAGFYDKIKNTGVSKHDTAFMHTLNFI